MKLREWESIYNEIMEDFGFSKEDDLKSALMLSDIIRDIKNNIPLNNMDELIKNKDVYVFGAGPSLKKHAKIIKELIESNYVNENDKKK